MIRLRTFEHQDFKILNSWIENPRYLMQFAGAALSFPLTEEQFFEDLKNPKRNAFSVLDEESKNIIGHAQILEKDATFLLGRILIGPENHRGKGLGQIIVQQLLDFGYQHFPNKSAELNVFDWNIGAIKCYEKFGFKLNPKIKKEVQIGNEIWTSVNMILD